MNKVHNTLIISDLHLGGDLNPQAERSKAPQLAMLEGQFVSFLRHYTFMRRSGHPWRLVINGDLIDFLGIRLLPGEDFDDATPDEQVYGLGRRPRVTRAKLVSVFERHAEVFRALARFVAAGNRMDIIAGNHDVEFQWEPVQQQFVDEMRRIWEQTQAARGRAVSGDDIGERIAFHPWFFYEPGVAWVEHGHLYDENCSFQFSLAPAHLDSKQIDVNVDTAAARYVINHIKSADYGQENWSSLGYLQWARSLGLRGAWKLARSYSAFSKRLLGAARRQRAATREVSAKRRARHLERLRSLSELWSVDEATLGAIDGLRKKPVINNLWRLLQIIAGGGAVDPTEPLMTVPDRILSHIDARYVVFGHSHDARELSLEGGGTYFNTGTWFPDELPGLLRCFTHVIIRHTPTGPVAELCQWRDGASRTFTPGYSVRARPPTADPVAEPLPAPLSDDAMAA